MNQNVLNISNPLPHIRYSAIALTHKQCLVRELWIFPMIFAYAPYFACEWRHLISKSKRLLDIGKVSPRDGCLMLPSWHTNGKRHQICLAWRRSTKHCAHPLIVWTLFSFISKRFICHRLEVDCTRCTNFCAVRLDIGECVCEKLIFVPLLLCQCLEQIQTRTQNTSSPSFKVSTEHVLSYASRTESTRVLNDVILWFARSKCTAQQHTLTHSLTHEHNLSPVRMPNSKLIQLVICVVCLCTRSDGPTKKEKSNERVGKRRQQKCSAHK